MDATLDISGLNEHSVKLLQEFTDFLREKAKKKECIQETERIEFDAWASDVKGKISREDIYDNV